MAPVELPISLYTKFLHALAMEGCDVSVLGGLDGRVAPEAPLLLNPRLKLSTQDQSTRKFHLFFQLHYQILKKQ